MNIADKIKQRRQECNMSQEYFAEKIGVTRQAVSKWETRKAIPSMENCSEIAKLFDMSLTELLDEKADSDENEKNEHQNRINYKMQWISIIPLIVFAGSGILFSFGRNDVVLRTITILIMSVSGVIFILFTGKISNVSRKKWLMRNLLILLLISILSVIVSYYVGNIVTTILVCVIASVYSKYASTELGVN